MKDQQDNKIEKPVDDGDGGFMEPILRGVDIGIPVDMLEAGNEEQILRYAEERFRGLEINHRHTEAIAALTSVALRISQGAVLNGLKKKFGRAKMLEFCESRIGISERAAYNWINLYENRHILIGTGLNASKTLRLLRAANTDGVEIGQDKITFRIGGEEREIGLNEARECTFTEFEGMINHVRGVERKLKKSESDLEKISKVRVREVDDLRAELAAAKKELSALRFETDTALDDLEKKAHQHLNEVRRILVLLADSEATMERTDKMLSITDEAARIVGLWREEMDFGEIMNSVGKPHDENLKKAIAASAQKAEG